MGDTPLEDEINVVGERISPKLHEPYITSIAALNGHAAKTTS